MTDQLHPPSGSDLKILDEDSPTPQASVSVQGKSSDLLSETDERQREDQDVSLQGRVRVGWGRRPQCCGATAGPAGYTCVLVLGVDDLKLPATIDLLLNTHMLNVLDEPFWEPDGVGAHQPGDGPTPQFPLPTMQNPSGIASNVTLLLLKSSDSLIVCC